MASMGEAFRTFLLDDSTISAQVGARVYQNEVQQEEGATVSDYIWYERAGIEQEDTLNMSVGQRVFRERVNVEAVAVNIDNALDLADNLRGLHGSKGTFGTGTALAVFVTDQADDYVPLNDGGDEGRHVASLQFEIIGHQPGS